MNVSVPRQCLGIGETVAVEYLSVGPISKYQGGWQPPAGYPPYVPKHQAKCDHHLFFMPKNEVHGRVGQLQLWAPGVGQQMAEHEQKAEIFQAKYPERYIGEANVYVHPTIAGMMHNYNMKFSELRIRNVCKLAGVKFYQLPSVKGFYSGNEKLHTCNIFTLK